MMSVRVFLIFTVVFGMSWAQDAIPDVLQSIPIENPDLQAFKDKLDPAVVENIQNKTLSEVMSRCEKNGGPEAYTNAQNAGKELGQCITSLVNASALQQEIEEAKPNGRVDEVFKKYCEKKPLFEGCLKNFTEVSKQCFSANEQVHLKTIHNVSQQLAEFICFKEGDRIALFIAEGGQECFQDNQEDLKGCVNRTMGLEEEEFDVNALSDVQLSFDEKQCQQILELQKCVVGVLETCPRPTSANIVESLFKFIRKSTPCKNFADEEAEPKSQKAEAPKYSAAVGTFATFATIIAAFATTLLI